MNELCTIVALGFGVVLLASAIIGCHLTTNKATITAAAACFLAFTVGFTAMLAC